jgi:FkbM family methyltransferase
MSPSEFIYTVILRPRPLRKLANAAIRAMLPETASVHGAKIALNPDDPVVCGALTMGVYEKEEIAFFRKHFKPDMNFADVGANVGLYTGMALATPGFSGSILCVEPDTESRSFLEKTISGSRQSDKPRVTVCPVAASDKKETVPFFRNPDNHGDNRLYSESILQPAGQIETDTLDTLCERNGISHVEFLKIDIQGAEGRAIAGARGILEASPRVILMTEFWPYGLERCGSNPEDYLAMLESLGFALHDSEGKPLERGERKALIERTSGRRYINLFGFKGGRS